MTSRIVGQNLRTTRSCYYHTSKENTYTYTYTNIYISKLRDARDLISDFPFVCQRTNFVTRMLANDRENGANEEVDDRFQCLSLSPPPPFFLISPSSSLYFDRIFGELGNESRTSCSVFLRKIFCYFSRVKHHESCQ